MAALRIAILGCGGIAHSHVSSFLNMRDVAITGLADPRPEGIRRLRERFPSLTTVPDFETLDDLLSDIALDGIVILTPHTQHAAQIMTCLKHELHVLVEKPMVTTPQDGEAVVAAAATAGKEIVVSYQRHFQPAYLYIKKMIETGAIGELKALSAVQGQNWRKHTTDTWRQNEALSGGGMLMDTGSHLVDVLTWLVDQPVAWVMGHIDTEGAPVDVNSSVIIGFSGGAKATMTVIGDMPYVSTYVFEDVTISGTKGALLYRNGRVYNLGADGFTEPVILPAGSTPGRHWVDVIMGHTPNASPPLVGLRVAQLTAAARESSRSGAVVHI